MNLIKRIKRTWELSNKDSNTLLELTQSQIDALPDEDTKAEFFGEGTHEDFEESEREKKGLKGLFGLK